MISRHDHHDRADWAAIRSTDGAFLGEAVLNKFDPVNESANCRIWLAGPDLFGRGYGTEITRLVVDYALRWADQWHDELLRSILRTDLHP